MEPFHASQGDLRLELVVLDSDARNRTVRALQDGAGPDIVMVPRAGDLVTLARAGYLADLSQYAARFGWLDRLLAPAALLADVDGKVTARMIGSAARNRVLCRFPVRLA